MITSDEGAWRVEKRSGPYSDLIWDDVGDRQHLIAEVHVRGVADQIVRDHNGNRSGDNVCPRCAFDNLAESTLCHRCGKDLCDDDDATCVNCGGTFSATDEIRLDSEDAFIHLEC